MKKIVKIIFRKWLNNKQINGSKKRILATSFQ